ncbi:hypothetical protein [Ktedonobacter sp. SOSP1-85]|uniref:hypothetical protein n=1 Tax=Ktedonobacter sp. SOSP1-85 TaxID=2778367 RepID=UPI0019150030|nr:hypothetical protein [Ktedonobacter sp. SOSP1-85]
MASNQPFLQETRQYLKDTQKSIDDACAPFTEGTLPARGEIINAIDSLEKAEQSIQSLYAKLYNSSSIPDEILENRTVINDYINTIIEQIEKRLVPALNKNQIADFSSLRKALKKIDRFLPKQNDF